MDFAPLLAGWFYRKANDGLCLLGFGGGIAPEGRSFRPEGESLFLDGQEKVTKKKATPRPAPFGCVPRYGVF